MGWWEASLDLIMPVEPPVPKMVMLTEMPDERKRMTRHQAPSTINADSVVVASVFQRMIRIEGWGYSYAVKAYLTGIYSI